MPTPPLSYSEIRSCLQSCARLYLMRMPNHRRTLFIRFEYFKASVARLSQRLVRSLFLFRTVCQGVGEPLKIAPGRQYPGRPKPFQASTSLNKIYIGKGVAVTDEGWRSADCLFAEDRVIFDLSKLARRHEYPLVSGVAGWSGWFAAFLDERALRAAESWPL